MEKQKGEKKEQKKMVKKNIQKSFPFFFFKKYQTIQQYTTTTMQHQDNLPPRISDSHFIHTQTVTCTTKHFGNDMIL